MVTNEQEEILQKQKAKDFCMAAALSSSLCRSPIYLFVYLVTKELDSDAEKGSLGRKDIWDEEDQEKGSARILQSQLWRQISPV